MAVITNDDLQVMVDVEELLYNKLVKTNSIADGDSYYFNENDKEYEIWNKYWNIVEKFISDKKAINKKSNQWNKNNAEYHRLSNNLYNARKNKNREKIEYYTRKLEELKK